MIGAPERVRVACVTLVLACVVACAALEPRPDRSPEPATARTAAEQTRPGTALHPPDEFLDRLAGRWILTGQMGATALRQRVDARWLIQRHFLRVHVIGDEPAANGTPPYEAIYFLGYAFEANEYVMHLFDTFGAGYSKVVGVGTRTGNSVEFLFDYPTGRFSNTFVWHPSPGHWEMVLRQRDPDGRWSVFATKTLTPDRYENR